MIPASLSGNSRRNKYRKSVEKRGCIYPLNDDFPQSVNVIARLLFLCQVAAVIPADGIFPLRNHRKRTPPHRFLKKRGRGNRISSALLLISERIVLLQRNIRHPVGRQDGRQSVHIFPVFRPFGLLLLRVLNGKRPFGRKQRKQQKQDQVTGAFHPRKYNMNFVSLQASIAGQPLKNFPLLFLSFKWLKPTVSFNHSALDRSYLLYNRI